MEDSFDVIVVGGGPGGSACCAFLSKKGLKVLLLEKAKFPRDKTCGDAISGKALRTLRELGLIDQVEANPHAKIGGIIFSAPNGSIADVPFPANREGGATGYCTRREVYDNILFQNAKKSVAQTIEGFVVTDLLRENGQVVGVKGMDSNDKQAKEFKAKVVVAADGAVSLIANKLGVGEQSPDHNCVALRVYYSGIKDLTDRIEIHFVPELIPGYFWIFPLENGIANVGVGMVTSDMQKNKINLQEAMFKAIKENPLFKDRFADAKLLSPVKGWTLPFGSTKRKCAFAGCLLIGDAASLIDPFSGEGIGNAMVSGKIASEVIAEAFQANDFSEAFLKKHEDRVWQALGSELRTSYKLQKIGRIGFLLNFVVKRAANSAAVREEISSMLVNTGGKKELVSPLFYAKLLFA